MKIWTVFVYCTVPGYQSRWIDSQWASPDRAQVRELELDRLFNAFKVPEHKTATVELSVVDAAIVGENPQ